MDGLGKLGIDIWWIIYYLVNCGILFAVLGLYVYPKIDLVLKKRQKDIGDSLDRAHELKKELARELEKYQSDQKNLLEETRAQKKKWLEEIEIMKNEILTEMELKKTQSLEETDRLISEKKAALMSEVKQEIYGVILRSFQHLSKKIPEDIIQESIQDAWASIRK